MDKVVSIEAVMPGDVIREELDARDWTPDDLAEILDRSRQHVSDLINGKIDVDEESAVELGKAFGSSAELWMNLQASYELSKNQQKGGDEQETKTLTDAAKLRRKNRAMAHLKAGLPMEILFPRMAIRANEKPPADPAPVKQCLYCRNEHRVKDRPFCSPECCEKYRRERQMLRPQSTHKMMTPQQVDTNAVFK